MYAPSRHGGREPFTTSQAVGGSSSAGERLPAESTIFGSKKGGGLEWVKVDMKCCSGLKIVSCKDWFFLDNCGVISFGILTADFRV